MATIEGDRPWSNRSNLDKIAGVWNDVMVWGERPDNPVTHAVDQLRKRPIYETEVLRCVFTLVYNAIPKNMRPRHEKSIFQNLPLKFGANETEKKMERLGSGAVNTVFLLAGENGAGSWAIGLRRLGFRNYEEAQSYALRQQEEYRYIQSLFGDIEGLVPEKYRLIYTRFDNKPGVMFIREFVGGPIRDLFDIPNQELLELIASNRTFGNQFRNFASRCNEHIARLAEMRLDIIGKKNLVVAGEKGQERLVLLEPHTCDSVDKNGDQERRIRERIQKLAELLERVV